ncbi:MAG TPA: 2-C-methyl-D-erythritol 4-phosphate cytidylyltransferase [Coxiellaceae bacterium]|nr:MAG: 2-C-methyl-D-erythritol 4-phosphate cytidylyltransferase [Gammaproteobacteria bacterium RIFCSPHIGHO2_12_FULL_36_30]HLB56285.1 2-C-methyl-D-erythritol 4-phosphate cytidylyltransferase [Coxiellaceae bacterium]
MTVKYWAIIPAAGISTRIKSDKPKQYFMLAGEAILQRVVNLFSSHPQIEKVVVVLHAKDHWWPTLQLSHPEKVLTAIGGVERVHSVLLGLTFLTDFVKEKDFILVHDAARPNLQSNDISKLISALKNHDVGGLFGLPVVDTLKKVNENDEVEKTVPRQHLWRAQTPQCFRYKILKSAIENALSENIVVTDESSAIEHAHLKPKMILGDANNIKITFPEDIALAEKLF